MLIHHIQIRLYLLVEKPAYKPHPHFGVQNVTPLPFIRTSCSFLSTTVFKFQASRETISRLADYAEVAQKETRNQMLGMRYQLESEKDYARVTEAKYKGLQVKSSFNNIVFGRLSSKLLSSLFHEKGDILENFLHIQDL